MISFQDVNKHYGHFHVLKNINQMKSWPSSLKNMSHIDWTVLKSFNTLRWLYRLL